MKSLFYDDLEDTLVSRRDPTISATIRQVSFSTTPYRSSDLVPKEKKTSGLIVLKKHRCNLPLIGFWRTIFFWLPRISEGSLFKCSKCKTVYAAEHYLYLSWHIVREPLEQWKAAGGDE